MDKTFTILNFVLKEDVVLTAEELKNADPTHFIPQEEKYQAEYTNLIDQGIDAWGAVVLVLMDYTSELMWRETGG